MSSDGLSYESVLSRLANDRPRLAALARAEKQRTQRTASLSTGARLKGVEELLQYLDDLVEAFRRSPKLSRLAFLLTRALADFETAAEATLSGYLAVAADAMRDVMEIENLLLDFAVSPDHIDEWLTSDDRTRMRKFMPVKVRKRLYAAGQAPFTTSAESIDYRGHSEALHVSPRHYPIAQKGFSTGEGSGDLEADSGFWEIFEHGRRLHLALRQLTGVLQPNTPVHELTERSLSDFEDGWERTQQMQQLYLALIEAALELRSKQEDESP